MSQAVVMEWEDAFVFGGTQHKYSAHGSGTETIPTGAITLVVEVWGATGLGGHGQFVTVEGRPELRQGGGGGSGGYCRTSISVAGDAGQTMTYTVGQASVSASTVVTGTFTITSMTGPLGGDGAIQPSVGGGLAGAIGTGGTVTNLTGNAGHPGDPNSDGAGGIGVMGLYATGPAGATGSYSTTTNTPGSDGLIIFNYS